MAPKNRVLSRTPDLGKIAGIGEYAGRPGAVTVPQRDQDAEPVIRGSVSISNP